MSQITASWQSLEQDPHDIYGRSLEDITLWADMDGGTVLYGIEFRHDQTHYEWTHRSAIKLYLEFVSDKPDYRKVVRPLFDDVLNSSMEEALLALDA